MMLIAILLGIIFILLILLIRISALYYRGPVSDHFDGKRFYNPDAPRRTFYDFLRWRMTAQPRPWPRTRAMLPASGDELSRIREDLHVTFVNHSTFLIQWKGINFLTDPIWSERASPIKWAGPKRVHPPGIPLEELPPIHAVLLSHNHYDHLDIKTLKYLTAKYHPKVFTGLGNARFLKKAKNFKVTERDWWQEARLNESCSVIYTPAQHFSARGILDRDKALWGGFLIKINDELIYYSGDTAYFNVFKEVRDRFGAPRLSMLPIGAYQPSWFMDAVHMSPQAAVQAHIDLGSRTSMAMHFGTFPMSDEGIDDPCRDLLSEMEQRGIDPDDFLILNPGETRLVP